MKKIIIPIFILLLLSCTGKEEDLSKFTELEAEHNRLKNEYEALKERNSKRMSTIEEMREEIDSLNKSLASIKQSATPYNGVWLDINDKGKLESEHFMVIQVFGDRAFILDLQVSKNEVIKNSFNAIYSDNKIIWPASPLSLSFEHFMAKELENRPEYFKDGDSVLKSIQSIYGPEVDKPEEYEGYFIKLNPDNMESLLKALAN